MTVTVQELIIKLDNFGDSATVQVQINNEHYHVLEVEEDSAGNAILYTELESLATNLTEDDDEPEELLM